MLRSSMLPGLLVGLAVVSCALSADARRPRRTATAHPHVRAARWIDSDPHVPLAVSDRRGVHDASSSACRSWVGSGSRWLAVDAWGAIAGEAQVTGGELYDVTRCIEPTLKLVRGSAGAQLYVAKSSNWTPPATSARWTPTAEQRDSFHRLVEQSDRVHRRRDTGSSDPPLPAVDARTMFFRIPPTAFANDPQAGTRWAVVGGPALSVFEYDDKQGWAQSFVTTPDVCAPRNAFKPIAVFDMDGDGYPELIFHRNDGPTWNDVVLKIRDSWPRTWEVVATSVGGSTA